MRFSRSCCSFFLLLLFFFSFLTRITQRALTLDCNMISSPSMSVWSAAAVSRFFSWYSNSEIWKCFHEAEKSWTWNYLPFCFFPKNNNKTQEPTTTTTLHKNKASYPSPPVALSPQKTSTCRLSSTVKAIPSCLPLSSDLTDNLGFHQPHHMSCSSKQSYKLTPPQQKICKPQFSAFPCSS